MSWKLAGIVKSLTHTPSGHKLSSSEKLFLIILADYSDEHTGISWPSVERLADECVCSVRTLQYIIKSMKDAGFVDVIPRIGSSNHYKLLVEGGAKSAPGGVQQLHQGGATAIAPITVSEPNTKNKRVLLAQYPPWLPTALWNEYLQMRTRMRKPLVSEKGLALAIGRLEKFRAEGHSPESVLEWSILNSYQGLFPPKADFAPRNGNGSAVGHYEGTGEHASPERVQEVLAMIERQRKGEQ